MHTRHHIGSRPRGTFRPFLLFLFSSHLHLPSSVSLTTPILVSSCVTVSCSHAFLLPQVPMLSPSRSCDLSPTRPFATERPISTLSLFLLLLSPSLPLAPLIISRTHTLIDTHSRTRSFSYPHVYRNTSIHTRTHTHTLTHAHAHTPTHTCMTPLLLSESRFRSRCHFLSEPLPQLSPHPPPFLLLPLCDGRTKKPPPPRVSRPNCLDSARDTLCPELSI